MDGVLPVLDPQMPAEEGMKVIGHISRGIDVLYVGLAVLVDHDAVVDLHSGIDQEIGDRLYSYTGHDEIALDATTGIRYHTLHVSCTLESDCRLLKEHLYPIVTVESRKDAPNLLAQHPVQRRFERLYYHDLQPSMAQRCSNLGANETHADQHRSAATTAPRTDAISIANRAQIVDTFQVGPRDA
jgi:hypothetical protein